MSCQPNPTTFVAPHTVESPCLSSRSANRCAMTTKASVLSARIKRPWPAYGPKVQILRMSLSSRRMEGEVDEHSSDSGCGLLSCRRKRPRYTSRETNQGQRLRRLDRDEFRRIGH